MRDIEAAHGGERRRRHMSRFRADEYVYRVLAIAVDERRYRPPFERIDPASGQREPLVRQVPHRWRIIES